MLTQTLAHTRRPAAYGLFARLSLGLAAWRQRRALERLDDAGLADIGLTHAQARAEARRPLWDVPAHWRK